MGKITDVAGISVGHATRVGDGWLTGVTVVIAPPATVGGVDVRGGGPGTVETDALAPGRLVGTVDAIALAGGSAYGLVAARGVQRWLEEQGRGYEAAPGVRVPIVPGAIIFDLGRGGDMAARPTEQMGYQAAAAAGTGEVARGCVGAGTGAVVALQQFKGGVGTASATLSGPNSGIVVGALAVVNALGMPQFGAIRATAAPFSTATSHPSRSAPAADAASPARPESRGTLGGGTVDSDTLDSGTLDSGRLGPANTTLVVVATNARLDAAGASRLATVAHDGLARALDPVHTLADGDTVFALATGAASLTDAALGGILGALVELHAAAAQVTRLAILDGVASAEPVTTPAGTWPRFPTAEQAIQR